MSELDATALAEVVTQVREDLAEHPGMVDVPRITRVLRDRGQVLGAAAILEVTSRIREHVSGLGPLQALVAPGVSDLLVNGDGTVWFEDVAGMHRSEVVIGPEDARELAVRLATSGGRRLDDAVPYADVRLPGGIRFHGILPPLSPTAALISLRLPAARPLDLNTLENTGTFDTDTVAVLQALVASRAAFLISGGTGSGKTTLLGALLAQVPAHERMLVVEDAQELRIDHPHVVHLQSRHANVEGRGEVDLTSLVRQCLRMRPDRIVVGECRGAEVRELLQALKTGHEGGCGTLHANTAADVPARLEALGMIGGLDPAALAAQAASALDVVLHLGREDGVRRLQEIALLRRGADGRLGTVPALDLRAGARRCLEGWPELAARLDRATQARTPHTRADLGAARAER
jgi:pilus assembly protein CpaF